MTRQYRQGDSPVRRIGRIADRRKVPGNGARAGSRAVRDRASGPNNMAGNSVSREPVKREPGATLELLFRQDPGLEPKPFLAYLEQNSRRLGNIQVLREISLTYSRRRWMATEQSRAHDQRAIHRGVYFAAGFRL